MKAALRVLRAGVHSTLQDFGRVGYRHVGVPRSGALDPVALRLLDALLRNAAGTAALEMMYSGVTVEAVAASVRVAVAGAAASLKRTSGRTENVPAWHTATLDAGDRLSIGSIETTAVAYLGVDGGFDVPAVLGSASTYVQGALGGYEGRALRAGDVVPLSKAAPEDGPERRFGNVPLLAPADVLRVIPGPQQEAFAADALERLLTSVYRVSSASNRAGLRLEGAVLGHRTGHDLLSEGVATGSIQVPGSGQPVVLIGDHPTVGGYPKIATVISADLAAAGRLRIGGSVRFAVADEAAAAQARRALENDVAAWVASIEA